MMKEALELLRLQFITRDNGNGFFNERNGMTDHHKCKLELFQRAITASLIAIEIVRSMSAIKLLNEPQGQ
ncbi:MAG: hypothetical protein ACI9SP_002460 [Arenicella sp.]